MSKRTEKLINDFIKALYNQIFNQQRTTALMKNDRAAIEQFIATLSSSEKYSAAATRLAKQITKAGMAGKTGQWRKFYDLAKKKHYVGLPTTFHAYEMQVYSRAVHKNFEMIKSIPSEMMEMMNHKYTSKLIEQVAKNAIPRGSFEKELASHGAKHAKLIARTETSKLQSAITEFRATDLGSVAYRWRSSRDRRTRPSHLAMDGVIVFWRGPMEKPELDGMRGNAGEFPNCRCDEDPIFDESDLVNSNYKVYDYRIKKVITMSKSQLIQALNNNGL